MSAGTLVPFMSKVILPGGKFEMDLFADIKTHPTIGPLFGQFKVQLDMFQIPVRLYNSLTHNNALEIGLDMSQVKLPVIEMSALHIDDYTNVDIDNAQINPSCLLSYLGIRGIGLTPVGSPKTERQFNAVPLLSYWEIYKNYYSNKQEEMGAVIHCQTTGTTATIDEMYIFRLASEGGDVNIPEAPATAAPITLDQAYEIRGDYGGAEPNPKQIFIQMENNGLISLFDFCGGNITFGINPGEFRGTYQFNYWGVDRPIKLK